MGRTRRALPAIKTKAVVVGPSLFIHWHRRRCRRGCRRALRLSRTNQRRLTPRDGLQGLLCSADCRRNGRRILILGSSELRSPRLTRPHAPGGAWGIPGPTPVVFLIQQPIDLVAHPATHGIEAGGSRTTAPPTGCTATSWTRPRHTIYELTAGFQPLIQTPIKRIIRPLPRSARVGLTTGLHAHDVTDDGAPANAPGDSQ